MKFFIIDRSRILYREKGFIRIKTVSFHSGENITYSVFLKINFIVPHFIHSIANFYFNKFHTNKRHYRISLIRFDDVSPSSLADTSPIVFSLYIFAIPPGWFGRIRKPLHSKPSTLHPYSINFSFINPNNEPLKSNQAFPQPHASCIRSPSLT